MTEQGNPLMMNKLAFGSGDKPRTRPIGLQDEPRVSRLLPPRSMVGQLPLEQHIGVRIPGGQPNPIDLMRPTEGVDAAANE